MNDSFLVALFQNVTLSLVAAFIFDLIPSRWQTGQALFRQVLIGFVLGFIAIVAMLTPWTFAQGIVFDTCSVLLGISVLFFGLVPTIIALAMTAAYRLYCGGLATATGLAVIVASGIIGIAWRHYRRRPLFDAMKEIMFLNNKFKGTSLALSVEGDPMQYMTFLHKVR